MMRNIKMLVLAAAALVYAHGGFEHVMGTVKAVTAQTVTVETTAHKMVEVKLDAKTKYTRNDKVAAFADMKVGDRVMIDAKEEANKSLTADSIKLGYTAPPATNAKAPAPHSH